MKAILLAASPLMLCVAIFAFVTQAVPEGIAAMFGAVLLAAAYSVLNRLDRIREVLELRNQAYSGQGPTLSRPPFFDPVQATEELRTEPKAKSFFRR